MTHHESALCTKFKKKIKKKLFLFYFSRNLESTFDSFAWSDRGHACVMKRHESSFFT